MNVSGLLDLFDQIPAFAQLARALSDERGAEGLLPLELVKGTRPPIVAQLYRRVAAPRPAPILLLTARVDSANLWHQALETWLPGGSRLLRLPEPTPLPYDRGPWSDRTRQGRLSVFAGLMGGQHPLIPVAEPPLLVVSSIRAFLQKTLPKRRFIAATRVLRVGQVLDLEKSQSGWSDIGYEPVSVVEAAGQFSRRGGIIDIFPAAAEMPVRIELFGDEVETMRFFDPTTQRSLGPADGHATPESVIITPAREVLPAAARDFAEIWADEPLPAEDSLPSWRDDLNNLRTGLIFPNLEYYLPLVYPRPVTLLDYLPPNALVIVDDWDELKTVAEELIAHANQIAAEQAALPPGYQSPLFTWNEIASELAWWQPLVLGEGRLDEAQPSDDPIYIELGEAFDPGPRYGGQVRPFLNQLKQSRREGERVVVFSRQATRLAELWGEDGGTLIRTLEPLTQAGDSDSVDPVVTAIDAGTGRSGVAPLDALPEVPPSGSITFVQGSLAEGFILVRQEDHHVLLHLLTDAEIFGWSRPAPRRQRKARPAAPETFFADIKQGDHVVHLDYGIGRFEGLVVRNLGGMEREYLLVQVCQRRHALRPVHHADRLGKWIGPDDADPSLNRLGERTLDTGQSRRPARRRRTGPGPARSLRRPRDHPRPRLPARHRLAGRTGSRLPLSRDGRPVARHQRSEGRHGAGQPDGPPHLRRRRLWQDRSRPARRVQGGHGRQAGSHARAHDHPGPTALHRPFASGWPLPGHGRDAVALPHAHPAAAYRPSCAPGNIDISYRHPPAAIGRHLLQRPGAGHHRRGAALRRGRQGEA
jgi:transcription-repair coupling factor (superfamily II helicase)